MIQFPGKRRFAIAAALVLSGCLAPSPAPQISIVGAKLDDGTGKPAIEYSVVIVADGMIKAAGRQQDIPVPKEGQIVSGMASTLEPLDGGTIEPGKPANLKLSGAENRIMRAGKWVK
ncbi:MAG: hypothetical protein ABI823_01195 [Bryobacteraceae bacterium]